MSGDIELIVRKGTPRRRDLNYYPYWAWRVTSESQDISVELTPTWSELEKVIREAIIHELKVDRVVGRREDFTRFRKFLNNLFEFVNDLETRIDDHEIPDIIRNCKKR